MTASARPRLLIHAGMGKAGSSAIQVFLPKEADHLAAHGLAYLGRRLELPATLPPGFATDTALAETLARAKAQPEAAADEIAAHLRSRIQALPHARCFIWSNIDLLWAAPVIGAVLDRLADLVDGEVVLYFRHQAAWLVSAYAQWGVKHKTVAGPVPSFDEFRRTAAGSLDYRALLRGWSAAVGRERLRARSLDRVGNALDDLLSLAGAGSLGDRQAYPTPDPAVLALFKLHHGQHDDPAPPGRLEAMLMAAGLDAKRYRPVDPDLGLPDRDAWQALVASFARDNEVLARKFGLELDAPRPAAAAVPPTSAAPATLIPVLLDLILALDARVIDLERRLDGPARDEGKV